MLRGTGASQHPRSLALTVTTTNCVNTRNEPYKARLELVYDYLVEYSDHGIVSGGNNRDENDGLDLIGVENAVAYGLASALDTCNVGGSPLYAVELASRHHVFKDGE